MFICMYVFADYERVQRPCKLKMIPYNSTMNSTYLHSLGTKLGGSGVGVPGAAIYDIIGMKLRQIPYSNRFYEYFQVNRYLLVDQFD